MTGAQIVILSMLGFDLVCVAHIVTHIGVQAKPTTKGTAVIAVVIQVLMGIAAFYLYAN